MFKPKKTKYTKEQKGKNFKKINTGQGILKQKRNQIYLKALSSGRVSEKNLLACKQTINKIIKKQGRLNIHIFANTPITKKPTEIRMGKGKGAIDSWVCRVKPGTILFEINVKFKIIGFKAFKLIKNKLPIRTKII